MAKSITRTVKIKTIDGNNIINITPKYNLQDMEKNKKNIESQLYEIFIKY